MNRERAEEIHDRAWADYMKAHARLRAIKGPRGSFKLQQAFIDASDRVRVSQERLNAMDQAVRNTALEAALEAERRGREYEGQRAAYNRRQNAR